MIPSASIQWVYRETAISRLTTCNPKKEKEKVKEQGSKCGPQNKKNVNEQNRNTKVTSITRACYYDLSPRQCCLHTSVWKDGRKKKHRLTPGKDGRASCRVCYGSGYRQIRAQVTRYVTSAALPSKGREIMDNLDEQKDLNILKLTGSFTTDTLHLKKKLETKKN